ncbi:MAG: class I SAM-dependent methyltransferase [Kiloniellaceae bacterium]
MKFSEAEIQVLASIHQLLDDNAVVDRAAVEARGNHYWVFKEDWSGAFRRLVEMGLLSGDDGGYRLTDAGRPVALGCHGERPDMYWYYYQKFYPAARASAAHSTLCERVFGENLCQEGQTDMASLEHLMALLDVKSGDAVLDLGCGAGIIAEYVSDQTGASVTGLDYAASAIAEAIDRTSGKRDRLTFEQGNFNALDFPERSFDAIIALDTLYWASDLAVTMSALRHALKPGGRMGVFMNHHIEEGASPDLLAVRHSKLAKAAVKSGLSLQTFDYTKQLGAFWHRNFAAATALRRAFEAEGNGFIADSLIRESEEEYLPDIEGGRVARYLYLLRC